MNVVQGDGWKRRGFSLLWDPGVLATFIAPAAVVSIRDFFAMRNAWLDNLPGAEGNALVGWGRARAAPRAKLL